MVDSPGNETFALFVPVDAVRSKDDLTGSPLSLVAPDPSSHEQAVGGRLDEGKAGSEGERRFDLVEVNEARLHLVSVKQLAPALWKEDGRELVDVDRIVSAL